MIDPNILKVPTPKSADMFQVEELISRLESTERPDLEKCRILYEEALKLFYSLKLNSEIKINALKWEATKGVNVSRELPLHEVEEEIQKAMEERQFDSKADELIKTNLIRISYHYKFFTHNITPIKHFVKYNLNLLSRVVSTVNISDSYTVKEEVRELREEVKTREERIVLLEEELRRTIAQFENVKTELKDNFLTQNTFDIIGKMWMKKISDPSLVRVILYLIFHKTSTIKELYSKTLMTIGDVKKTLQLYPDFFDVNLETQAINLNYKLVQNEGQEDYVEQKVKAIVNKPEKQNIAKIFQEKIKNLFKKKKNE